jgi:hypothetical protein
VTRVTAALCDALFAEAAARHDRLDAAEPAIATAVTLAEAGVEPWCAPEVLRIDALVGRISGRLSRAAAAGRLDAAENAARKAGAALWLSRIAATRETLETARHLS